MAQHPLDDEYQKSFITVKRIVMDYLGGCYSCRNSREHCKNHIQKKYPWINSESIRRVAQKIQNDEGLFVADREVQNARQAKELWMRDNIGKI
jgi:hypothetical protein